MSDENAREAAIRQAWADRGLWEEGWRKDWYGHPEEFVEAIDECFACGMEGDLLPYIFDSGDPAPFDRHLLCGRCRPDAKAAGTDEAYQRWFDTRTRLDAQLSEAIRKGINPAQTILDVMQKAANVEPSNTLG